VSAYDNDPRVTSDSDGAFTVDMHGARRHVCVGQLGGFVTHDVGFEETDGPGFDTADEAIRSLIGEPA
jgi:hypothetical protein